MGGYIKFATDSLLLLQLFVFITGFAAPPPLPICCSGGQYEPPRSRTASICTTLAAALVLFLVRKAAGGGGRLLRGLLLLGVTLSAASSFLIIEPLVDYAVALAGSRGWGYVPLAVAVVVSMTALGIAHVSLAMLAMFDLTSS